MFSGVTGGRWRHARRARRWRPGRSGDMFLTAAASVLDPWSSLLSSTLYMALAISCADLWKQSNDHGVSRVSVDAEAGAKQ